MIKNHLLRAMIVGSASLALFAVPSSLLKNKARVRPQNNNNSLGAIQTHVADEKVLQKLVNSFELRSKKSASNGTNAPSFPAMTRKQKTPVARMVYLVPSDKLRNENYKNAIEKAFKNLQIWYRKEMGDILTFTLYKPGIEVLVTPHISSWYANHDTGGDMKYWFWENVLHDAFSLTGAKFNDPHNRWIFYIDADPVCGEIQGAGTSGVSVLPANDLRGLAGEARVSICPNDPPDMTGICRWVGGLGHELGHAFDLPHPASCENGSAQCPSNTLMWLGYITYPNTYLLPENKNVLKFSPFFSASFFSQALPACGM